MSSKTKATMTHHSKRFGESRLIIREVTRQPRLWSAGFQVCFMPQGMFADAPLAHRLHDMGTNPKSVDRAIQGYLKQGWKLVK